MSGSSLAPTQCSERDREHQRLPYPQEQQGDVLFMAIYFYDTDGRPTWLVSAGGFSGPMNCTGRLLSVGGGRTLI